MRPTHKLLFPVARSLVILLWALLTCQPLLLTPYPARLATRRR